MFFILCFCFVIEVSAQQIFTVKGVISKKLSAERVPQVLITNLRSKDIMMSDELGYFSVSVAIGDTLLFARKDFTEQKIAVTGKGDMAVYLQPVIRLAVVNVQAESKKQELEDFQKDYGRKGIYYNGNPPLASLILNPLNDLHLWLGKDAADLRRFKADSKAEIEHDEVQRRYTIKLVKEVTNAPDSTAKKFMEYYTPSYEDLKEWNDYDLVKHIKKSYDYYVKNRDRLHLESINAPILTHPDLKKP